MAKISVVINALNAAADLETALESVKWTDEIVVVDDGSVDETVKIAKKYTKKVFFHKSVGYVEPARNFAISKTKGEWILILDTDEEIPNTLAKRLQEIAAKMEQINYVEIPRKNIIFNKWMKASMWWPDYNIRFFRKGDVSWEGVKIHRPPKIKGEGMKLPEEEQFALIHYHYKNLSQFLERMIRYTKVQADELEKEGDTFKWQDLIQKPLGEFLGRYFANRGFEDGLHGLALALLQSFSFLIVHLRLWERGHFKQEDISLNLLKEESKKSASEINYWFKYGNLSKNPFKKFVQKVVNKMK